MLKNRILSTLKFFDLQDYPLTLLELDRFLIVDGERLRFVTDFGGELNSSDLEQSASQISIDQILNCLDQECQGEVANTLGFYHLIGKQELAYGRLNNYFYGIKREKLIRRYTRALKYIPFVRGAALAGSQAMGLQKESSDIDLFIIVDNGFLWLSRTLVTAYFQVIGKRRHGQNITNRFCLNHYLVGPKEIGKLRNLYTASEYLKLRPLCYEHVIWAFAQNNKWLKVFFANANYKEPPKEKQNALQYYFEKIFTNRSGRFLEKILKNWQLPKIRQEKFIVVEEDELSFHPDSKQEGLLRKFLRP